MVQASERRAFAAPPASKQAIEADLGFDKERVVVVQLLLPLLAALALGWFVGFVERTAPLTWVAPLSLLAIVGIAYTQLVVSYRRAALVALLGTCAALTWAIKVNGNTQAIFAFGPLVTAGIAVLGARWGWAFVGGSALLIITLPAAAVPDGALLSALTILGFGAWISWVTYRPLHTLMSWAWQYLMQVESHVEDLRASRAELTRTLASLDHAYYRLKQANYDLERARKAAEEARRFKAEFAANVSHELRTPLNLILGFSEVMVLSPQSYEQPLPAEYRGDIEAIYRSARYLSSLVDDVLDLSGIEASRMALQLETVDLRQICAQAQATVSALFTDRGLWLRTDLPSDLPPVNGDPTRLRQVLINLLNNATRFTERGGVIIGAQFDEHSVTLAVQDTGIGIPADKLDLVFNEFEQLGAHTHRQYGGSGLGLAISKQFVELHGGRIWATSEVGTGTTFFVTIPREPQARMMLPLRASTTSWASPVAQDMGQEPMLLVVDDDTWTARMLQRYLDGYRVYSGSLAALPDLSPQAVLVNTHGALGSWPELAQVCALFPQVPVFVCALPTRRDRQRMLGVDEYVLKPVTAEQLLAAIDRLARPVHSVLVVDDDAEFVQLMARMLSAPPRSYRVLRAQNGRDGLAQLRAQRPDLVILDLLMPEMDGYAMLEQLREDEALGATPVIVVSARGYEREVVRASMLGVLRADGLSVGDLVAWLRVSMATLSSVE
jgi:signal transduction histidine kinase/CheY-like chemotaxis protein